MIFQTSRIQFVKNFGQSVEKTEKNPNFCDDGLAMTA